MLVNFVVGNVAPTYQKSTKQLKDKQCVDLTNNLAQYNARLKDLLLVELKDIVKRRTLRLCQRL